MDIPERDWKIIRSLQDDALDLACTIILKKAMRIINNEEKTAHQKYQALYGLMRREDKGIARQFDNLKRSNAIQKLISWRVANLITDEEFQRFSKETRDAVDRFLDVNI